MCTRCRETRTAPDVEAVLRRQDGFVARRRLSVLGRMDQSRKNDRLPCAEVVSDKGPANCLGNLGPAVE